MNEEDYWPSIEGCYVADPHHKQGNGAFHNSSPHPKGAPNLQTKDERDKRIDEDYQKYMKVQKRLLEENPTDYDTPTKLKRNMPLTRENFVSMNGGRSFWGGGMSEVVKSFIQNDLHSFANEIYEEVIQSDWFIDRYTSSSFAPARRTIPVLRRPTSSGATTKVKSRYQTKIRIGTNNRRRQRHSFYNPRGTWYKPSLHNAAVTHKNSIEKLKSIFDASLDRLGEHMSPEDKESVKEVAWSKVGYRDYEGEYFNRKEHTQPLNETIDEG